MADYMNANRTEDWPRLLRSNFFKIDDAPGCITISLEPKGYKAMRAWGWGLTLGGLILLLPTLFVSIPVLIAGFAVLWSSRQFNDFAWSVRYTPDRIEAFTIDGKPYADLSREAMQQIAVEAEDPPMTPPKHPRPPRYFHRFVADTGWFSAFPTLNKTEAAVRNNVLMVAFDQPLHLDGLAEFDVDAVDDSEPADRPLNLGLRAPA